MITDADEAVDVPTGWKLLPHDADVRVYGSGPTAETAFEQAALALKEVITEASVTPKIAVAVVCEASDIELLFVEWLNAIIFEMATRQMLFSRFKVAIRDHRLTATLWGEPVDQARHMPACEAKGATYTALRVAPDDTGRWSATCVVDV